MTRPEAYRTLAILYPDWYNYCPINVKECLNYMSLLAMFEERGISKDRVVELLDERRARVFYRIRDAHTLARTVDEFCKRYFPVAPQKILTDGMEDATEAINRMV
jgi:hypothetical protein